MAFLYVLLSFFFFNDTATTEIYTLSLHDALPISPPVIEIAPPAPAIPELALLAWPVTPTDRKITRLNSSHVAISYAVFCLKKKKQTGTGSQISKLELTEDDNSAAR